MKTPKTSRFWGFSRLLVVLGVAVAVGCSPGQTHMIETVGGYTVELRSLDPYPETPGTIPLQDYRATMLVVRAT